jgi:hypothetical protein
LFGFPLTPSYEAFSQFKFRQCKEILKYLVFLSTAGAGYAYGLFTWSKTSPSDSPITAMKKAMNRAGVSDLDWCVLMILPVIGGISNSVYLYLFAKGLDGLNKVSGYLTTLNEEFHNILGSCRFTSFQNQSKITITNTHLLGIIVKGWIAAGMMASCWIGILFKHYSDELSIVEKICFSIAMVILCNSYLYPPMAISADTVVLCLIAETADVFGKFKLMITPRKKIAQVQKKHKMKSNHSPLNVKTNVPTLR